ncbi:MAG TPA: transcriptional regulator [Candidatus Saccharimonadales bacterium]|nr:transcriptional regulator [Candidatus Saccharimonadales bacterium]HVX56641.1 transcriptional regulator [Candidatus Saccharimonadales bacterium]
MTERQQAILNAIVEQYAEVASPVGSTLLAKLFNVSSATIRAEMAELERLGYISQPHTSAGRVPTDKGYRYYVNNLNESAGAGKLLPEARAERALAARVQHAGAPERTIRNAVDTLVELTHNLGLATIGNQLYISGLSNLFGQPEFMNAMQVQQVAQLLDNLEPWLREAAPNEPLSVYIGHENPVGRSAGASLIISRFRSPFSDRSYIGTLGPTRQSYRDVMALVSRAGQELEDVLYA